MSYQPTADQDERTLPQSEVWRRFLHQFECQLRVAEPGIVQSFDPVHQTVSVQLAVTERLVQDGTIVNVTIPPLPTVPIVIPRAGGYSLTMPISAGDECLVVFADMDVDDWFQSGGVVNQILNWRHNLNDGFAIFGCWNQTRLLSNYSTTSTQLRSDDGSVVLDIGTGKATLTASAIKLAGALTLTESIITNPTSGKTSIPVTIGATVFYLEVFAAAP